MLQSHIITIDGVFVGVAVRLDRGFRFVATDIRMDDLDGSLWPSLEHVQRLAGQLFRTGRFGLPPVPAIPAHAAEKLPG